MEKWSFLPALAIAAMLGACATPGSGAGPAVEADARGARQHVHVSAVEWVMAARVGHGFGTDAPTTQVVEGAHCTLRNERGRWDADVPAAFDVDIDGGPLHLECVAEGFKTFRHTFPCTTPRSRRRAAGGIFGLQAAANPATALLGPAGAIGVIIGGAALGAAAGHALTNVPHPDTCDYGDGNRYEAWMTRGP